MAGDDALYVNIHVLLTDAYFSSMLEGDTLYLLCCEFAVFFFLSHKHVLYTHCNGVYLLLIDINIFV